MTALEMKYEFDIKLRDVLKALNHPFTTHEISRFLNGAQLKLVQEYSRHFEENEEVRKVLSVLVDHYSTTTFTTDTTNHTNGKYVTLPGDFIATVSELINGSIRVKPMTLDEYSVNINNPFKEPSTTLVWRLDRDDKHELITNGTVTLTEYEMNYVSIPPDIDIDNSVNCVLSETVQEDIIDKAVQDALIILSRKTQLFNTKSDNK